MYKKRLCILIEGNSDKALFDRVIKPRLERKYASISLWKHAEKTTERINIQIESAKEQGDYIFVPDNDELRCIPRKKKEIREQYESIDDKDRILIVTRKIESWYLAGLNDEMCKRFGFPPFETTDKIGKGKFRKVRRVKFRSDIDFMQEILKHFDIETAKRKNKSFEYFVDKYDL